MARGLRTRIGYTSLGYSPRMKVLADTFFFLALLDSRDAAPQPRLLFQRLLPALRDLITTCNRLKMETQLRHTTLSQGARIQGVTPTEISLLAVMLRKKLVIQKWAKSFLPHFEQTPL